LTETTTSLAFWLCLLFAVAIYATVVLSPKVVRWSRRADEFAVNQRRLQMLRRQIEAGEQLAREWQSNRHQERNASIGPSPIPIEEPLTNGKVFAVEDELRYRGLSSDSPSLVAAPSASLGMRILEFVAGSRFVQVGGLALSASLLVIAFTLLTTRSSPHDSEEHSSTVGVQP